MNLEHLCQHWVHEAESSAKGVAVYRPDGVVKPAPRRFRMEYIFHPDGRLEWLYLSPDCRHHFKPGSWRLDDRILYLCKSQKTESEGRICSEHDPPRRGQAFIPEKSKQKEPANNWPTSARSGGQSASNELRPVIDESRAVIIELSVDRLCLGSGA